MRRILLGMILMALATAACDPVPPTALTGDRPIDGERPADSLIAFYDELAFGHGSPDDDPPFDIVTRWTDSATLSVHMIGETRDDRAAAEVIFDDVEALTGLTFRWGTAATDTIVIRYSPPESWEVHQDKLGWVRALTSSREFRRLVGALVYIDSEASPSIRASVLRHEIFHGLGFLFHTGRAESVLAISWSDPWTAFTELDAFAIRTHFDPRIDPGMSRDSVHAVLGWTD